MEERLVNAQSPAEIVLWTQIRGEILRQDEEVREGAHRRGVTTVSVALRAVLSLLAVAGGGYLFLHGYTYPGLFFAGAGLYQLAPKFVMQFVGRRNHEEPD